MRRVFCEQPPVSAALTADRSYKQYVCETCTTQEAPHAGGIRREVCQSLRGQSSGHCTDQRQLVLWHSAAGVSRYNVISYTDRSGRYIYRCVIIAVVESSGHASPQFRLDMPFRPLPPPHQPGTCSWHFLPPPAPFFTPWCPPLSYTCHVVVSITRISAHHTDSWRRDESGRRPFVRVEWWTQGWGGGVRRRGGTSRRVRWRPSTLPPPPPSPPPPPHLFHAAPCQRHIYQRWNGVLLIGPYLKCLSR